MSTQQNWFFRIGDGATPEVFTQLAGEYDAPEFTPFARTIRGATTIADAQVSDMKKNVFNKMIEGPEMSIVTDYLPEDPTQARLIAQEGVNAGVNVQYEYVGPTTTTTWEFNVLVMPRSIQGANSEAETEVDQATYTFKMNSYPTEVTA